MPPSAEKKQNITLEESTCGDGTMNSDGEKVAEPSKNELVQDVMAEHLQLMLEIVMKIREDEKFAMSIYANCPRLQHLLDQHPDLRPVFEDPNLVRVNFEQVYKKAGGVLPEDKPSRIQKVLKCVVNHPLFKVLRFLLVIKKCYNCFVGGGMSMLRSCICGLCAEEAIDSAGQAVSDGNGGDGRTGDQNVPVEDADGDGGNPENRANKEALNRAADHMEDPEVQERMHKILESEPDKLSEAIEHDPELKALRDSNPLCEELMKDSETMKILVDPDNLRALGEAPDLIEQDYINADWQAPDIENANFDDNMNTEFQDLENVEDAEETGNAIQDVERQEVAGGEEEGNLLEDFERGEVETDNNDTRAASKKNKAKGRKEQEQKNRGAFAQGIGAGMMDLVAGELVGMTAAELTGGGGELDALEEQAATEAEAAADGTRNMAASAAATGELLASDDIAGNLEETLDTVEEKHDDQNIDRRATSGAAAGGVAAAGGTGMLLADGDSSGEEEEEQEKKKGFRAIGSSLGTFASAVSTAAKEHVATTLLGDDFGEELVERIEEGNDDGEDEDETSDKPDKKPGKRNFL